MRRTEALVELSREHQAALSLALRARRAAAEGGAAVAVMSAKVGKVFHSELKPHFDQEERWLLQALTRAGETAMVARILANHAELAGLVERLAAPDAVILLAFADCLTGHVRFEEGELFLAAEHHPERLDGG